MCKRQVSEIPETEFQAISQEAVRETIRRFEETGSPIITGGEQTKPSFAAYPIHGASCVQVDFTEGRLALKLSSIRRERFSANL